MSDPLTVDTVLARVDEAWATLERTVRELTPAELATIRDPAGWAVKDHLLHLAAWERVLVGRLDGRPDHETLGLEPGLVAGDDEDAINDAIFRRQRDAAPGDVLESVRATHAAMRARLAALRDGAGAPGGAARAIAPPAADWIEGNTWAHYLQHLGWIRELTGRR
ncbi:MAG TPA: DinB family protein [Methylomirabilota bacterium]|jgi:hypothetical protein|nr:DinB family protein [Methylomirabilota bacterium]